MAAPHELFAYSAHWTTSAPAGAVSSVKICPTRADKPTYIAIALSGGPTAVRWAVETFDDVPSGGWSDVYRTRKLVLRRIPAGSFEMGVRASDLPGAATDLRVFEAAAAAVKPGFRTNAVRRKKVEQAIGRALEGTGYRAGDVYRIVERQAEFDGDSLAFDPGAEP